MSTPVSMAAGSQLDGTPCESPDGSHSGLAGISQAEHDNQLDANQGALVVGASCCLADECQATTWNDDGSVILSQPPTGLVDWTSLHREELSKRVVQSMGKCFVLLVCIAIIICILDFQLEQNVFICLPDMSGR